MSVIVLRSRCLSLGPSITVGQDWLLVEEHAGTRILSLFSYGRSVRLDRRTRRVHLQERRLYRTQPWSFSFNEIDFVAYEFGSLPSSFINRSGLSFGRADEFQDFSVLLVLKDGRRILVARFLGEGAVETGWIGTLLEDDLVDWEGEQGDDSRGFLRQVLRLTGAPLGIGALEQARLDALRPAICSGCGQRNRTDAQRCLYCGREMASANDTAAR